VQAAVGLHQLGRLDEWIDRRAQLWRRYDALLEELPLQTPPAPEPDTRHARHLYRVLLDSEAPLTRDQLLDALTKHNIGTGVHYRAVHLHPFYRDKYGLSESDFPVATAISERTLSLPLSPKVTESDQDDVAVALGNLWAEPIRAGRARLVLKTAGRPPVKPRPSGPGPRASAGAPAGARAAR
jgi:dTDP-4-amino-4,6-dideoxygalactose transaminase